MSEWKKVRIGDFLTERTGRYKPNDDKVSSLKRLDKINFSGEFYLSDKASNTDMVIIKSGDLVISGINVSKGALSIYTGDEDITATIHYSSYTFNEAIINIEYFKRFLKSQAFTYLLTEQVKGGIKTEIKAKHLLPITINLPDLEIQQKMVEHFESYESEAELLQNENAHQKALLKKLRQSILQDAVSGKITAQWRVENPITESATELLKRIQSEKEELVKAGKIKKQKPLPPVKAEEIPFDLPDSWVWCRLCNIIYEDPRNGYSPKAVEFVTDVKSLKLGATTTGKFIETELKYINEKINNESFLWLKYGDILIQRSNSLEYVGVSAIYKGKDNEFIYPDLMMKFKLSENIDTDCIFNILSCKFTREYYRNNAVGAQKSMPKINQSVVSNTLIPLPPLAEQQVIVAKVEALFKHCDQLEAEISASEQNSQMLLQTVLKEAFNPPNLKTD